MMFYILVGLNIADLGFTAYIIYHGSEEVNPLVNYLIQQFGIIGGILVAKVPPVAILGYILYNHVGTIKSLIIPYMLGGAIIIYCIVNVYSLLLIMGML